MKTQEIKFQNKSEKYSIFIGENAINLLPNKIKTLCPETRKIGVVVDKNLLSNYKKRLKKLKNQLNSWKGRNISLKVKNNFSKQPSNSTAFIHNEQYINTHRFFANLF